MRIAYLHYLYGNDTALNHVRQFSESAREQGHVIDVLAMNLGNLSDSRRLSKARQMGARVRQAARNKLGRFLHEPKELLWNFRYIRKERDLLRVRPPDILLVRDHHLTSSCVSVARQLGVPLVVEMNSPAAESELYGGEYVSLPLVSRFLERYKLNHANEVTVVSTALKDYFVDLHGLDPGKFHVVTNGADIKRFHPSLKGDRKGLAIAEDAIVVGFVGSFQTWHGTEMLGKMASQVGAALNDAHFLFVGDGPELSQVRNSCLQLGNRVTFVGRVSHDEVPGLVACFDIGVVADAGFYMSPLKLLEWMAAGRAIVAPHYGPIAEVIADGIEGLLFEPGDHAAMISAVLRLAEDEDLRRHLGRAAAARVSSCLTWDHNARKVLQICRRAVRNYQSAQN